MTTQNPYLLLTPGPLSTTPAVREAMLRDWCTWDADYNNLVEGMKADLVALAIPDEAKRAEYTAVPMQGSGTYGVESVSPRTGASSYLQTAHTDTAPRR